MQRRIRLAAFAQIYFENGAPRFSFMARRRPRPAFRQMIAAF